MRVALFVVLAGCGGATSANAIDAGANGVADASTTDAASPAPAPAGPYPITCTMYRGTAQGGGFAETKLVFMSDVDGTKTTTLNGRTFEGALEPISDAPDEVLFRIAVVEARMMQEFRLRRRQRPAFEYIGFHGFTGLIYADGSNTQYVCMAGDSGSTPAGGVDEADPPLPLRARCALHGRDGTEKVLDIDGPGTKKADDGTITVVAYDDRYEGRSLIIDLHGSIVSGTGSPRQLLQLARTRRLVNLFGAEHGFTGRTSAAVGDAGVVSYACATVE